MVRAALLTLIPALSDANTIGRLGRRSGRRAPGTSLGFSPNVSGSPTRRTARNVVMAPSKAADPDGAARVCVSLFQGLVLQQAWDPKLDVDGYIGAVLSLIEALVRPPGQPDA
jgi:hypothetical protein